MIPSGDVHLKLVIPPDPWVAAMANGRVRIPGYTWESDTSTENAMLRFDITRGADVGENGVRRLVIEHLRGADPTAIPVAFGREHMQRNLLVRRDSDLHHPMDLMGKRVGSQLVVVSGTGAGVMMMLEQAYGVPLVDIEWRMGDPESLRRLSMPGRSGPLPNRMGLRLGTGGPDPEANVELLLQGDLDAVIVTGGPRYRSMFGGGDQIDRLLAAHPGIRPLIDDPLVIADAYRRTGLYLISDLVVLRPLAVAQDPDLPVKLFNAFSEANALASEYRSTEEEALARREIELVGEDPHRYGLGANQRHNLSVFIDFLYRLGAFDTRIDPEDLFIPSTRGEQRG